ncbi:hypothetical protein LR48_Vigan05g068400 [Vigna angularis]|uniref:Uncharacterized protein n=1 Tax=Phaseolus angularis TaxID=3914 RepID=A0A0L9UJM8_PHAAN|nr:hypothetical protein LR48_Vigan05g068400 [Vigna angularis]
MTERSEEPSRGRSARTNDPTKRTTNPKMIKTTEQFITEFGIRAPLTGTPPDGGRKQIVKKGAGTGEKEGEDRTKERCKAPLEDKTEHSSMPDEKWRPTKSGVDASKSKSVDAENVVISKQLVVKAESSSVLLPFVQAIMDVHISESPLSPFVDTFELNDMLQNLLSSFCALKSPLICYFFSFPQASFLCRKAL